MGRTGYSRLESSQSPERVWILVSVGAGALPKSRGRTRSRRGPCAPVSLCLLAFGVYRSLARLSSPVPFVPYRLPPVLLRPPGVPAALWSSAGSTPSSPTSRPPTARCSTSAPSAPWRSSQPPAPTRTSTRSTPASATSSPSKCSLRADVLTDLTRTTGSILGGWDAGGRAQPQHGELHPSPFRFPIPWRGSDWPRAALNPLAQRGYSKILLIQTQAVLTVAVFPPTE